MPRTHVPAPLSPPFPAPPNGHACSACKAAMRLVTIEPHPRYSTSTFKATLVIAGTAKIS
jgi:hypothetical protein